MTQIRVSRMPSDPGISGWDAILPARSGARQLDSKITADWLVIGAGFAGLAAVRRLKILHPYATVVLVEARRMAEGPVGRNTGFMIDLPHNLTSSDYAGALEADRQHTAMNRSAIRFAEAAANDYGFPPEAFIHSGKTNGAATAKGHHHNLDYAKHLQSLGEPHELLDEKQMLEMCGSRYYRSGLYTPGTAMIQPALYAREMAAGLAREGVLLFENSPVTGLSRSGSTWTATTKTGSVEAPSVILTVNGHVESFGFFQRRLMHIYLFASMTKVISDDRGTAQKGQPAWSITPADPLGTTMRKFIGTGGSRIVVRNGFTWTPKRQSNDDQPQRFGPAHVRSFNARFPDLAVNDAAEFDYSWGGLLCLSRNGVSAFGKIDEGLYSACCQNGLGAARGTSSGMMAAELASGMTSDSLKHMLAEAKPTRLPPEPFSSIGANVVMKWGEYKAGAER